MGVLDMWSVCDRCGFNYKRRSLKKETTGSVVCQSCYDGAYDLKSHPQNRPFRPRRELIPVPDGRAQQNLDFILTTEANEPLLTEDGFEIRITNAVWSPPSS